MTCISEILGVLILLRILNKFKNITLFNFPPHSLITISCYQYTILYLALTCTRWKESIINLSTLRTIILQLKTKSINVVNKMYKLWNTTKPIFFEWASNLLYLNNFWALGGKHFKTSNGLIVKTNYCLKYNCLNIFVSKCTILLIF